MKILLRDIFSFTQHGSLPKAIISPADVVGGRTNVALHTAVLVGVDGFRWLKFIQKGKLSATEVHCFEPNSALYHQLKRSFSDIHLHHGSLSEREQVDSFIHYLDQGGSAGRRLNGLKDQVNVLVKSYPLTQIMSVETPLDLLVVDRGFTLDRIIEGANELITAHHPEIVFQQSAYAQTYHAGRTYDLLTQLGYQIRLLGSPQGDPLSRMSMMAVHDKVMVAK